MVCGKEHSLLLTEHGQVFTWGGGSRGQLGHGNLASEDKPKLVMALDGMRIRKVAAGGWHSACISQYDDLYMFGWNESGQLAQPTNLTKPAECFRYQLNSNLLECSIIRYITPFPSNYGKDAIAPDILILYKLISVLLKSYSWLAAQCSLKMMQPFQEDSILRTVRFTRKIATALA